ncbi:MAG: protein translocase subunit SecD [Ancalomicrobiaceae bacterium]|nr:protein translocase subunit SecD [Ancalomicrobiaceae bacterium]
MLYFSRWKILAILAVCVLGIVFATPNFLSRDQLASLPEFMRGQMVLGLDLQGGAHLLLEVDTKALIKDRVDVLRDDVRKAMRDEKIGVTGLGLQGNGVVVRVLDSSQWDKAETKLDSLIQNLSGTILTATPIKDITVAREDNGLFRLTLTDQGITYRTQRAVEQSIEVIRRRIDQLGTTEPSITRQGDNRVLVQVPGLQDIEGLKKILAQTARLTFQLVEEVGPSALQGSKGADTEVLYTRDNPPIPVLVQKRALVSGDELVDAQAQFNSQSSAWVVNFRFDTAGAQKFAAVTQQNVGRPFAIVLDNHVISYPNIREPILGGSGQISGNFDAKGASELALLLRAGALPANLTIVEERTVGAGLGADSIATGERAAAIGIVGVILYMLANYGLFGLFANVAVMINVTFTLAILSIFHATLTLPGIAGIVLGVGMAVDANVLIYERIREEQMQGRSPIASIDTGFRRAIATITDTNSTHLIASIVLFWLGTGAIKGFALTLAVGTVTSFFTAVTVTRLMVTQWLRYTKPTRVPI